MNPSTAFGVSFSDELVRCGLREVVLAPGSRSTPLAMAFFEAERQRPAAAARPDRRAIRLVHRARPGQGERPAGGGAVHLGHGGGQLPPGRDRGRRVGRSAARAHRRPAARAAGHRRQPGHRPDQAVRRRGALVLRGRRARGAAGDGRLLALAGLPGLGARGGQRGRPGPARFISTCPSASRSSRAEAGRAGRGPRPWTGGPAGSRGPASAAGRPPAANSELPWTERGVQWSAGTATTTRWRWSTWPDGPAGRCSPSLRPAPGAGRTRCPPTSTCSRPRSSSPLTSRT